MNEIILKYRLDAILKTLLFLTMASFLSYSILEFIKVYTKESAVQIQLFISTSISLVIISTLIYKLTRLLHITENTVRLFIYTTLAILSYLVFPIKTNTDKLNFVGLKSYIVSDDEPTDGEVDLSDNGSMYELFVKFDSIGIHNRIKDIKDNNKDYEIEIIKEYFLFPQTASLYGYKTIRLNNEEYKIKISVFDSLYVIYEWFIKGISKYFLLFLLFSIIEFSYLNRKKIKSIEIGDIKDSVLNVYSNKYVKTFIFVILLNIVVWTLFLYIKD